MNAEVEIKATNRVCGIVEGITSEKELEFADVPKVVENKIFNGGLDYGHIKINAKERWVFHVEARVYRLDGGQEICCAAVKKRRQRPLILHGSWF